MADNLSFLSFRFPNIKMAAAATLARSRDRNRLDKKLNPTEGSERQQVSFHLKQHFGEEVNIGAKSSTEYLRQTFVKHDMDSRGDAEPWTTSKVDRVSSKAKILPHVILEVWVEKLVLHSDADKLQDLKWQPRLLVLANKALFILRVANHSNKDREIDYKHLEIVDSIPLHEIAFVDPISSFEFRRKYSRGASIKKAASMSATNSVYEDSDNHVKERNQLLDKYDRMLSNPDHALPCLRITTAPEGFNDGRPYYFLFGSDFVSNDPAKPSIEEFAREIRELSETQKQSAAFQVRLRRFQAALQSVWQSTAFNLVVLALIVSNFVFTVRGMESTNPDDDGFFERVDLIYTLFFALGAAPSTPSRVVHTPVESSSQAPGLALGAEARSGAGRGRPYLWLRRFPTPELSYQTLRSIHDWCARPNTAPLCRTARPTPHRSTR